MRGSATALCSTGDDQMISAVVLLDPVRVVSCEIKNHKRPLRCRGEAARCMSDKDKVELKLSRSQGTRQELVGGSG